MWNDYIFSFDKLTCLFFKRIFHSKRIISLSNFYVVARTLRSKNISGPRLRLNLAWLSSSLLKLLCYNAILFCFVEHLYFECDRHGQRRGYMRLTKPKASSIINLTSLPAEIELHDQVKLFTKINHFSKEE